jgi:cysteine desulfurase family protein (TIGR01976 family)
MNLRKESIVEFPLDFVRDCFPVVKNTSSVYFDNAAGTQVPLGVAEAVNEHLLRRNVQRGGRYRVSEEVDRLVHEARESLSIFVNAFEPDEIVFGLNASSFIGMTSLAIADTLEPGDEVVVTELDHEANVAPWLALEKRGIRIKFWRVAEATGRLSLEDLDRILTDRTRVVAVTKASNVTGTIVDIIPVAERVRAHGGYLFVDAVQFAPHGPLDVRFLDCDFLVCSGYKIFGPHLGFMWGRKDLLDSLPTFREYFVKDEAPHKYELGTFSYEAVAGMNAVIGYVEEIGRRCRQLPLPPEEDIGRRGGMRRGMQSIRHYERSITGYALDRFEELDHVILYGVTKPEHAAFRTPTFLFNIRGMEPAEVSRSLAEKEIFVRDGHMYSPRVFRSLGLDESKGAVRASLVHYNRIEEIDRLMEALRSMRRR